MKFYSVVVLLMLYSLSSYGQEIEVIEERLNDSIILYAENHTDTEFDVTFYVDYNGFVTKESSPVSVVLAPKVKAKLMTLIAPPG
ncbi:MAG: hypothetical protein WBO36_12845, partial [Saprospiraceae bacterium]